MPGPTPIALPPVARTHAFQSNDKLYTFALTDPDAPNPAEPKFAEWVHWLSVNRGASGAGGDDLVAFFGSAPGQGAGIHRYVLVVYEQAAPIHSSEPRIPLRSGFPPRRSFNSRAFAATHGLRPVAVLTYRASWDESVPGLVARIMPEA